MPLAVSDRLPKEAAMRSKRRPDIDSLLRRRFSQTGLGHTADLQIHHSIWLGASGKLDSQVILAERRAIVQRHRGKRPPHHPPPELPVLGVRQLAQNSVARLANRNRNRIRVLCGGRSRPLRIREYM